MFNCIVVSLWHPIEWNVTCDRSGSISPSAGTLKGALCSSRLTRCGVRIRSLLTNVMQSPRRHPICAHSLSADEKSSMELNRVSRLKSHSSLHCWNILRIKSVSRLEVYLTFTFRVTLHADAKLLLMLGGPWTGNTFRHCLKTERAVWLLLDASSNIFLIHSWHVYCLYCIACYGRQKCIFSLQSHGMILHRTSLLHCRAWYSGGVLTFPSVSHARPAHWRGPGNSAYYIYHVKPWTFKPLHEDDVIPSRFITKTVIVFSIYLFSIIFDKCAYY